MKDLIIGEKGEETSRQKQNFGDIDATGVVDSVILHENVKIKIQKN